MLSFYLAMIESEEHKLTFDHIYHTYAKQMYAIARAILTDHHITEDAVQDALMGLARSIEHVPTENESVTKAYIFTVTSNTAKRFLKKEIAWRSFVDIDTLPVPSEDDMWEILIQSEDYQQLLKLIDQLEEPYKEVLFMRYVADLKPKQMAEALGRKTATVQQQLFRAKHILEELYRKENQIHGK